MKSEYIHHVRLSDPVAGCEDIILPLVCDFFPIEVLFNIYASMK